MRSAAAAAAPGAHLINIGASAGDAATLASATVRGKRLRIEGYSNFAIPPDELRAVYLEVVGEVQAGRVQVDVETYALDDVATAWERLASGAGAKLVVTP